MKNVPKYSLFALLFLFTVKVCFAQQGNNWYFGNYAGISFNTSPPVVLYNSALSTSEGCATISDENGGLLFYTDGTTVYDKTHQAMPNGTGLMGHPSSTNSAIIVRQPGSDSLYFIFTADAQENFNANGFRYSVVDISLNAGKGDITQKNILLYAKCTEQLTAVKHANKTDIWIVTKDFNNKIYKSFRLGCNGLDLNPVVSDAGIKNNFFGAGGIKASPDGNKIAVINIVGEAGVELYHFNRNTGKLFDSVLIKQTTAPFWGVEFSPDSKLLYVSSQGSTISTRSLVLQFKIDNYDSAVIANSKYQVDSSEFLKGNMQIGPDGKIYIPNEEDSSLNVIAYPNVYGPGCGYQYKAIHLGYGRTAERCLPAFFKDNIASSDLDFSFAASGNCDVINFNAQSSLPGPLTYVWDFGDGHSATGQQPTHTYTTNGSFTVKLLAFNPGICGADDVRSKQVEIYTIKPVSAFGFETACNNKMVAFLDSSKITSGIISNWFWEFGDGTTSTNKNPQHTYLSFGTYRVKLTVTTPGICTQQDTISRMIEIFSSNNELLNLGSDSILCDASSYVLHAGRQFKNYLWKNGSTDSILIVTQPGIWWVEAKDYCDNIYRDTIEVKFGHAAKIYLGNDTSFCNYKPIDLNAGNGFLKYLWNTGQTTQSIAISATGTYFVQAENSDGCFSRDTVKIINVYPLPVVNIHATQVVCFNQNDILNAGNASGATYIWQDASTNNIFHVPGAGLYKVTVTNEFGCKVSDSVNIIKMASPPHDFLRADTTICNDDNIRLSASQRFNEYLWQNGSSGAEIIAYPSSAVWLKVLDGNNCKGIDTIKISGKDCTKFIFVPNIFTPNNDGKNDVFRPVIFGTLEQYEFLVFNIYGELIFRSTTINEGWDGKYRAVTQTGTFVWICKYKRKDLPADFSKGSVILLR